MGSGAGPAVGGSAAPGLGGPAPTDVVLQLCHPGHSGDPWWLLRVGVPKGGCWPQHLVRAALSLHPSLVRAPASPTAFGALVAPKLS